MSISPEKELKLTENLPLWAKNNTTTAVPLKQYSKDVLFQVLFGLYAANLQYGINPVDFSQFLAEKKVKHKMQFAFGMNGSYDVFEMDTEWHVTLLHRDFKVDTDLQLGGLSLIFKNFLEKTPEGNLLLQQLQEANQDYGSGLGWGPNLVFFHPFFKEFYTQQDVSVPPFGMQPEFIVMHEPKWTSILQDERDKRNEARELIYNAKIPSKYKVKDFRDEIIRLLQLWDESYALTNSTEDREKSTNTLKAIYASFKKKYTESNVDQLGILRPFTAANVADKLVDTTAFSPNVFRVSATEEPYRTRGHIAVFLFLIGKASESLLTRSFENNTDINKNMTQVAFNLYQTVGIGLVRTLVTFGDQQEIKYTPMGEIFKLFDEQFRGEAKRIENLLTRAKAASTTYYKYTTDIKKTKRSNKNNLTTTNPISFLDILIGDLEDLQKNKLPDRTIINLKETSVKTWEADVSNWNITLQKALDEERKVQTALNEYTQVKSEWGVLTNDYKTLTTNDYTTQIPVLSEKPLIDAESSDLDMAITTFKTSVENIRSNELKKLTEEIQRITNLNEAKSNFDNLYKQAETLYNDAKKITDSKDYNTIWTTIQAVKPQLDLPSMQNTLKNTLLDFIRKYDSEKKIITSYEKKTLDLDNWVKELSQKASQFQRDNQSAALQNLLDSIVLKDTSKKSNLQQEITAFKNKKDASRKELNDEKTALETKINAFKTTSEQEKLEEVKKDFPSVITQYDVQITEKNKKAWMALLEQDNAKIKAFVEKAKPSQQFLDILDSTDPIDKARVAAVVIAGSLPKDAPSKRKLLAFGQIM